MHDFPPDEAGPGPFFLRVVQTSISDTDIATWAIGKMTIKSSNDDISYPLMVNKNTYVGKKIDREFVSYPNILPDISAYARSLPGISDTHITHNATSTRTLGRE